MRRKIITIPINGDVDVTRVLPIVDALEFQRLRDKKQLGVVEFIFPAATHSRFEHCVGVFDLTRRRVQTWMQLDLISEYEAWNLCLFSLLHDYHHAPFSHILEKLCSLDHDQKGAEHLVDGMGETIEACGGDVDMIQRLFEGSHPLESAVKHHPLGTDKLDYLVRDALATVGGAPPAVDNLLNYTYFINETLMLDIKSAPEVLELQGHYAYMYERVYQRKASLIIARFLQRMVHEMIDPLACVDPELTEQVLWSLTDSEVVGLLHSSHNPIVCQHYQAYRERCFPRAAISLRISPELERSSLKTIAVFEIDRETVESLEDYSYSAPRRLRDLEQTIDAMTGLPPGSTLVVPAVSSRRFTPSDIVLYRGRDMDTIMLSDHRKKHFEAFQEQLESFVAIRICVPDQYREQIARSSVAGEIRDLFFSIAEEAS